MSTSGHFIYIDYSHVTQSIIHFELYLYIFILQVNMYLKQSILKYVIKEYNIIN